MCIRGLTDLPDSHITSLYLSHSTSPQVMRIMRTTIPPMQQTLETRLIFYSTNTRDPTEAKNKEGEEEKDWDNKTEEDIQTLQHAASIGGKHCSKCKQHLKYTPFQSGACTI